MLPKAGQRLQGVIIGTLEIVGLASDRVFWHEVDGTQHHVGFVQLGLHAVHSRQTRPNLLANVFIYLLFFPF
jgi:hypothetical protein